MTDSFDAAWAHIAPEGSFILRDAVIHSRENPYATALGVIAGRVAWLGSEGLAGVRAAESPQVPQFFVDGAFVGPAFVDAAGDPGAVADAAQFGVAYVDSPGAGTVLNPMQVTEPLAEWQAAGEFFAFGSAGEPYATSAPWGWIRAALLQANSPLTARAAFNAATRAGHRLAGRELSGEIETGAAATFAIFRAEALAVQTPPAQTQAWSTDVRAGTPLLPVLEADTQLPAAVATFRDGTPVFLTPDFLGTQHHYGKGASQA